MIRPLPGRPRRKGILFLLALVLMASAPSADAVKLWKWKDKDGKVHYSETKPPPDAEQAEEKQIDPNRNVIEANIPPAPAPTPRHDEPPDTEKKSIAENDAKRRAEAARAAHAARVRAVAAAAAAEGL